MQNINHMFRDTENWNAEDRLEEEGRRRTIVLDKRFEDETDDDGNRREPAVDMEDSGDDADGLIGWNSHDDAKL